MIPSPPPRTTQPTSWYVSGPLRDAGPVTPTVLAVAGTALAACHTGSRLGPSCRPGSSRGGHLVGLPHHRPTPLLPRQPHRSLDRNPSPTQAPRLSDWRIVVYGYRLVVAWQEPAVEGTASLVLLCRTRSMSSSMSSTPAGTPPGEPPTSMVPQPRTTPPPTPPGTAAEPPSPNAWPTPTPSSLTLVVLVESVGGRAVAPVPFCGAPGARSARRARSCGCKAFFGGHGYDPTDQLSTPIG